ARHRGHLVGMAQRLDPVAGIGQGRIAPCDQRGARAGQAGLRAGIAGGLLQDRQVQGNRRVRVGVEAAFGQCGRRAHPRLVQSVRGDRRLGRPPGQGLGDGVVAAHGDAGGVVLAGLRGIVALAAATGGQRRDRHGRRQQAGARTGLALDALGDRHPDMVPDGGRLGRAAPPAGRLGAPLPHRTPRLSDWISDPEELRTRLQDAPPRVGLDTEVVRERTWWPRLALVQLSLEDGSILLADAQAPGIPEALARLLADSAVLKVMHSASEDLVALKHACGVVPAPLFDTQVASALAGIAGGIGYQRLVQELLGVALPKGETRSDWMRRPLSPAQLEYAEDDVVHLFALHDALAGRLQALDRLDWLREDCARMVANAASDAPERWPHLSLRSAQYLDEAGQHRLLRLLRWREAYAREADRPRNWILDDELATALARKPPEDRAGLQRLLQATPKAPRNLAGPLWEALTTPLDDEAEAPPVRNEERDKAALRALQDRVAALSAELALPEGVLASRRWLQSLLERQARGELEWPGPLSGWRRALLEPRLSPVLESGKQQTA